MPSFLPSEASCVVRRDQDLPIVVSVGLGQIAATIACVNLALQVVPADRSSVLAFTVPLWVAVILWSLTRDRRPAIIDNRL